VWTIGAYGQAPSQVLTSSGALGSGCTPNTDDLPDGVWFGWINDSDAGGIEFDLSCLWQGRLQPAASNDVAKLRSVPFSETTLVHVGNSETISFAEWGGTSPALNAPGLPKTLPFWVFVNDGVVTEMAEFSQRIEWARGATAWPQLSPGCCDGGTVAPPSPDEPWPVQGWPTDGFYNVSISDVSESEMEVTISKWLSCADHPERCPEWWTGDEVTTDPDVPPLVRSLPLNRDLTVVVLPIFSTTPIVGDGQAFRELLTDVAAAIDMWIIDPDTAVSWDELVRLGADPEFPFGTPSSSDDDDAWPVGYRGPGGTHLTYTYAYDAELTHPLGWTALEIRDGRPILYVHAGIVAG
jgi:hypothetical protein